MMNEFIVVRLYELTPLVGSGSQKVLFFKFDASIIKWIDRAIRKRRVEIKPNVQSQ